MLENGANSSFVHQIVDEEVDPAEIAADPFDGVERAEAPQGLCRPAEIFGGGRLNSRGFDLSDEEALAEIEVARQVALPEAGGPLTVRSASGPDRAVFNPATGEEIGRVREADPAAVSRALEDAELWDVPAGKRAEVLRRAADLYEENYGVIFAALAKEAGKFLPDAVGELREAVDFLRYYAGEAECASYEARGVIVAISHGTSHWRSSPGRSARRWLRVMRCSRNRRNRRRSFRP